MKVSLRSLMAPPFYPLHHELKRGLYSEYWLKGGRGSTKSSFVSIEILYGMIRDPLAHAVIFRRFQNELRDTVYGQMQWASGKLALGDERLHFGVSPMQATFRETGQKILFRGADKPSKLRSVNLGRGYIKYVWFEEASDYASYEEVRNILQSLFRGEDDNRQRVVFFTYNPPKSGRAWINQEVRVPKPGRRVHHSTYLDVPRHWLGQKFITEAEHLKQVNEMAYRHEYLGEEVGTGLEVFTNVVIEAISDAEISRFDQIRQGLDFGYAADPLAFERMHFDRRRRRLYVIDEIQGLNLFNRQFFERISAKGYHRDLTIADSAEPKSIDELLSLGMRIQGARKGPGSVEFGIKWLQDLETIVIDPVRAPLAAREFVNYSLEVGRDGQVKSRFPDKDNHSIDAARYGLEDDMGRLDQDPNAMAVLRSLKVHG